MSQLKAWKMTGVGKPMELVEQSMPALSDHEVRVRVAACGVCHTDLGFFYDGVRTVKALPLTLGHEISGQVEEAGAAARSWVGKYVLIPAVMPCGECELCRHGMARICRNQKMPGNHIDGGFASHVIVPSRFLCPVNVTGIDEPYGSSGVTLRELCAIADAITTPFQAIQLSGMAADDVAVFIGAGGVGGFGIQIAQSLGVHVAVIDVDEAKLEIYRELGIERAFNPKSMEPKEIRKNIQAWVQEKSYRAYGWKIFETSGTAKGQELAFSLLTFGAVLGVVGYTMDTVSLRLSNLMAFDARAIGNWGCDPALYPDALEWVRTGKIKVGPFVERFPMSEINSIFERAHERKIARRPVLVPDFK